MNINGFEIKGMIFDLDGTILDSMNIWADIDKEFLLNHGHQVPEGYVKEIVTLGYVGAAKYTIKRFNLVGETVESVTSCWTEMAKEKYKDEVLLKPFAKEFILKAYNSKLPLAVASANKVDVFEPCLVRNDIAQYFSIYQTVDDVKKSKDFPDVYLLACQNMGIKPSECLVLEDTKKALEVSKKAGFITCGVYEERSGVDQDCIDKYCDIFINSFKELL